MTSESRAKLAGYVIIAMVVIAGAAAHLCELVWYLLVATPVRDRTLCEPYVARSIPPQRARPRVSSSRAIGHRPRYG